VVGLAEAMHKKPAELSQGMRQRVGIARAFALSPKMLLLDEPFVMLDSLTRFELQQVLIDLWSKDQKTALMVTHDVDEALFLADRIAMMTNGPAAEVGEILEVNFPRPRERKAVLEHPDYYRLREHLITFLEVRAHRKTADESGTAGPVVPPKPAPGRPRFFRRAQTLTPSLSHPMGEGDLQARVLHLGTVGLQDARTDSLSHPMRESRGAGFPNVRSPRPPTPFTPGPRLMKSELPEIQTE
jgi:ABC-type multidrug transport system ATPase subunit